VRGVSHPPVLIPLPLRLQSFLNLCQGTNHYQFDTIRRAKHSSMMVLFFLHNPEAPTVATTCNVCNIEIDPGGGYRCTVCNDFDICLACKERTGHQHPLVVSSPGLLHVWKQHFMHVSFWSLRKTTRVAHPPVFPLTSPHPPLTPPQEHVRKVDETRVRLTDKERQERHMQMQRTMTLLIHASSCVNPQCVSNSCRKV